MKSVRNYLLIMGIALMFSTFFSWAQNDENMGLYNSYIITNNVETTYVEGYVERATGQTISIRYHMRSIAKKQMPNHGKKTNFRIKIPSKYINDDKATVMYVIEHGTDSRTKKRIEIEYIERKQQSINTSDKYEMTFPGADAKIKAKSTSGEPLSYVSNKPDVAMVDESGNITPTGEGEATITVKQIGSGEYEAAEQIINVSVKAIDAYTITFHSTNEAGNTEEKTQIIDINQTIALKQNDFINGEHEFLGWATSEDDYASYLDNDEVTNIAEKGENVDLYAVWSGNGVKSAISWAIKIAEDDSFTYGKKPQTSKVGCYFCGTNCGPVKYRKPKGYEKTYVCMTFVHAAYAHGTEDPEMLDECKKGSNCIALENTNFTHYSCWDKVGLCSNLNIDDLLPGDLIVWYAADNNHGHISMYMGDNTIVDSTSGAGDVWGPNSIAVRPGEGSSYLRTGAKWDSKSYVMRYNKK